MKPGASPYRPLLAAVLSALVPGLGQLYSGRRSTGWVHLAITGLVVIPAAVLMVMVFYLDDYDLAIDLSRPFFRNPSLLFLLLALNLALVAFRVYSIVDALTGTGSPASGAAWVIAGALVLLLAVPHLWVGHRNLLLHDLLTHDFEADLGQAAATTTTAISAVTTSLPPSASTSTTIPQSTTTTTVPRAFTGLDRVNVLLLGSDAGVGRVGIRTDTMIILSVDTETGDTAMFSIPRNFIKLPIPPQHPAYRLWPDGAWGDPGNLAWGIYAYGLNRPDLFSGGNTGGAAAKAILGHLVGLDIHYFAMVDLQGFVDVIDALGGVDITVTAPLSEPAIYRPDGSAMAMNLQPGTYHMDGQTALAFSRSRRTSNDYVRMGRQRCVLEALARQADPVTLLRELPELAPAIQASVVTDIPMAVVPDFLEILAKVDTSRIVSIRFMPNAPEFAGSPTSYVAYRIQGYNVPNVTLIRERVAVAITAPFEEAIETLNVAPLVGQCGVEQIRTPPRQVGEHHSE